MKFANLISKMIAGALFLASFGCSKQMSTPAASAFTSSARAVTAQASAPFASKRAKTGDDPKEANKSLVPQEVVIPSGTAITVRLQNAVSSATSHAGDEFEATLDQPLEVDGQTVAPEGSHVTGRVVAARHSGRLTHPGYLRIALSSVTVNGKSVPIQSSSVIIAGASHKRRNLAWIGGGAGGGALIGAIASGGTGALIGTAIGAAGGTSAAYATGKKDVGFGAERRLTFRLTRPATIV
ncbi:MAG TPA: hypothetical protein VM912_22335 [Terriglobales bacterium]|nr:hypothetical protein [Terriglobales bacterium]